MSEGHGAASGARLRLARRARGFSQLQMASMAGVSRQAVSAVESGISDPSLRVAMALARALGMTIEELFGSETAVAPVAAAPVAPLGGKGARVTLASMGTDTSRFRCGVRRRAGPDSSPLAGWSPGQTATGGRGAGTSGPSGYRGPP